MCRSLLALRGEARPGTQCDSCGHEAAEQVERGRAGDDAAEDNGRRDDVPAWLSFGDARDGEPGGERACGDADQW